MGKTGIQWTDETWNYFIRCSRESPGCDNCYAFALHDKRYAAWRKGNWPTAPEQYHHPFSTNYRDPETDKRQGIQIMTDRLNDPYHWRKPRRVFVNSMSDVFHPDVPGSAINDMWQVMFNVKRHTYQVLTKRAERMLEWTRTKAATTHWPIEDIWPEWMWPGVSVENQEYANRRVPYLLQLRAAVPYLSMEPLLGFVDLTRIACPNGCHSGDYCSQCCNDYDASRFGTIDATEGLKWVIIGGESGPRARPMELSWVESLIEQCQSAGVAVFVKQLGTYYAKAHGFKDKHGGDMSEWPEHLRIREFPIVDRGVTA